MTYAPSAAPSQVHRVGRATIQKIWETDLRSMTFEQLFPDFEPCARSHDPSWFPEGTYDGAGHAIMSVHSWLVRHQGLTILVDAGAGNDKQRPQQKALDRLSNPFLQRLMEAGVAPEEVDAVLLTHIHSDHVGWNTRLVKGYWTPTFPNPRIVVSGLEYSYGLALAAGDGRSIQAARDRAGLGDPVRVPVSGTFADSILPLDAAKVSRIVVDGSEVLPGIRFLSTAGHSIDHASIELTSDGEVAIFAGDVFHHPLEVYEPDLVSTFCEFPAASKRARRWLMDRVAKSRSVVFSSHFPLSSAGTIERSADGYGWSFR